MDELVTTIEREIDILKMEIASGENVPWIAWYCFLLQVERLVETIKSKEGDS